MYRFTGNLHVSRERNEQIHIQGVKYIRAPLCAVRRQDFRAGGVPSESGRGKASGFYDVDRICIFDPYCCFGTIQFRIICFALNKGTWHVVHFLL